MNEDGWADVNETTLTGVLIVKRTVLTIVPRLVLVVNWLGKYLFGRLVSVEYNKSLTPSKLIKFN